MPKPFGAKTAPNKSKSPLPNKRKPQGGQKGVKAAFDAELAKLTSSPEYQTRKAELESYGIDVGDAKVVDKPGKSPLSKYKIADPTSGTTVQEGRDKALRVNQREQLRSQNQEITQLQLSGKKRRRGRGSLLSYMGSQNKAALGPSGTLQ